MSIQDSGKPKAAAVPSRQPSAAFELRDLELFAAIADVGTITGAARRVHLSLPAASGRLRAMERDIGVPLATRRRRGVELTAAGRLLKQHATAVLAQLNHLHGDLADLAEGLTADVRLHANTSALDTFLPDQLTAFLQQRPEINVDLRERPSPDIVAALARGDTDLGIVASSVDTGELACHLLLDDELVAAVPAGHDLTRGPQAAFADCIAYPLIGLSEARALSEHLDERSRPFGDRPRHRLRLPTLTSICAAVSAGLGIAIIPRRVVTGWPDELLAAVPLTEPWADRSLLLCHAPDIPLPAHARDLHEFLTAAHARHP